MEFGVMMVLSLPIFALGIAMTFWGDKLRVNLPFFPGLCAGALVGFWGGVSLGMGAGAMALAGFFGMILGAVLGGVIGRSKNAGLLLEFFACGYGGAMALICGSMLFSLALSLGDQGDGVSGTMMVCMILPAIIGLLTCLLRIRAKDRGIMVADCVVGGALCASWGVLAALGFLVFPLMAGAGLYVQMRRKKAAERAASAPAAPVVPVAPATPAAPAGPACPHCGMPLTPGTKFCPECGQTVAPEAPATPAGPVCPGCGLPLKPGAKFCPGCGQRLAPQDEDQKKTEE